MLLLWRQMAWESLSILCVQQQFQNARFIAHGLGPLSEELYSFTACTLYTLHWLNHELGIVRLADTLKPLLAGVGASVANLGRSLNLYSSLKGVEIDINLLNCEADGFAFWECSCSLHTLVGCATVEPGRGQTGWPPSRLLWGVAIPMPKIRE